MSEGRRRNGSVSGSEGDVPATVGIRVPSREAIRESGKSSEEIVYELVGLGVPFDEVCVMAEAAIYTRENRDRIRRDADEARANELILETLERITTEGEK